MTGYPVTTNNEKAVAVNTQYPKPSTQYPTPSFFIRNSRRSVVIGGVSIFVVAGCLSRSGRAGLYKKMIVE
jgi:hypothetical protein